MLMEPTLIAAIGAAIGALFTGIGLVISKLFSRNQNKQDFWTHEERLIELCSKQTDSSDKLAAAIDGLRDDITGLSSELTTLNARVLKLELERDKS